MRGGPAEVSGPRNDGNYRNYHQPNIDLSISSTYDESRFDILAQLSCPRRPRVAATYNREQIRAALAQNDPALSFYLDLETGSVVKINETESSPDNDQLRDQVMEGYGDRYRYIPGGNTGADDSAVTAWLEAEGI